MTKSFFMTRHPLIQALRTLSRAEMRRFREMAESPYFNKHRDVRKLIAFLEKIYPDFSARKCERARLAARLFAERHKTETVQTATAASRSSGMNGAEKHLAVVFTYAWRLFREFAALEQERGEKTEKLLRQLVFFRQRGLFKIYDKRQASLKNRLENSPMRDSRHYLQALLLESELNHYHNIRNTYESAKHLMRKQQALDSFFFSEKLKDACELHIRNKITKTTYELSMLEVVLQQTDSAAAPHQQLAAIVVYRQILLLLQAGTPAQYEALLKNIRDTEAAFSREELQNIYNYLQNYCIEQINSGQSLYLRKAYKLYQRQLQKGLLLDERGFLPEWHYKNITTIGLRLGETEWVHQFIHEYREQLPPDAREAAFTFNLAAWHYACAEYKQVLQLLVQLEYNDFRYYLGAKALLLRTYYELEEYEALASLAEAFRQYLKRHKILADERVKAFRKLLRFTRRALLLKIEKGLHRKEKFLRDKQKLEADIQKAGTIINKEWLMEKVRLL